MFGAATVVADGALAGASWLIMTYLLHTFGELCLSPVGLSNVTKLAPKRFVGQMMGHRHVGMERKPQGYVEGAAAHFLGQLFAAADPFGHRHEHHRRNRPEGAGAPQMDSERLNPGGDPLEVLMHGVHLVQLDGRRWHQGDVCRDLLGGGIPDAGAIVLQLSRPRLG